LIMVYAYKDRMALIKSESVWEIFFLSMKQ
jgi:hypothetical protein